MGIKTGLVIVAVVALLIGYFVGVMSVVLSADWTEGD